MRDAMLDLLLGATCVGCARPGRLLCRCCEASLPGGARPAWPTPTPAGLAPPWAAAAYEGLPQQLVLGLKEHRLLALRPVLSRLLAAAVRAASAPASPAVGDRRDARVPIVLVPVPSRTVSVRERGHDSTYSLSARAAACLRAQGYDVEANVLLRTRPGVVDQAGLGATARAENLRGSMACSSRALSGLARRRSRVLVVVCDDVITTGSTAREAQRALEASGLRVAGIACVAATTRRHPGPHPGPVLAPPRPGRDGG